MCSNKYLFTTYQSYNGGNVYEVTSIGSIRLKLSNGIIRGITNVKHIPELKRDLISLSMLDKTICSIRVKSSILKVVKGSMVLMRGDMINGLYILQGTVISGDVSISENEVQDKILLWYLRLGYISEKGLKELEK